MKNTMRLRVLLKDTLLKCCKNIYYEEAVTPYQYPYIVYELQELTNADGMSLVQMEVNVIDYAGGANRDTNRIEGICDAVQAELDYKYVLTDAVQFSSYAERRQLIREPDRNILRRRLTFEIRLHERM